LKHHRLEFNPASVRLQAVQLFLATVALLVPSTVTDPDTLQSAAFMHAVSVCLAVLLIVVYGLGLLYSLETHPELFRAAQAVEASRAAWPIGVASATLAAVTVLVAFVSEVF